VIEFKNLVKRFGARTVLNGLNLKIPEGEILFILGTSGTGKSVLLKNILGLMTPDEGEIWIDGEEVSKFTEDQYLPIRKKCGMVFQSPALFDSLTVFENVAFGLRRHFQLSDEDLKKKVYRALELVHLQDIDEKKPAQISFGMQKRVSLARTIALSPKILLFDEPTTGLDPITSREISQLIMDLRKKYQTSSIIITHDMACAKITGDKILVLQDGKFIAEGSYEEVAERLFNALEIPFYFLEYDSPRAGNFTPLRFVPKHKSIVLGLISSKTSTLEDKATLRVRIEDACRHVSLDRLAVSPQCGFASVDTGNPVTPQVQEAKLRLVVELARDIWGEA